MKKNPNLKTCLVLGATGFIGGYIAQATQEQGYITKGFRRTPGATGHLGDTPIQWIEGNLENKESLLDAMKGVDVVFHAAGYYPSKGRPSQVKEQVDYAKQEIDRVLQAALQSKVDLLVYTSSLTTHYLPLFPVNNFYFFQKITELIVVIYQRLYSLSLHNHVRGVSLKNLNRPSS